jgi:hypothetical protein
MLDSFFLFFLLDIVTSLPYKIALKQLCLSNNFKIVRNLTNFSIIIHQQNRMSQMKCISQFFYLARFPVKNFAMRHVGSVFINNCIRCLTTHFQ